MKYPEDIREHKELRQFQEVFKEFDPAKTYDDDFESEELTEFDEDPDRKEMAYGKRPPWAVVRPIRKDESAKHKA